METLQTIEIIDPKEYGLEESQASEVQAAFMPKIVERDGLAQVYAGIITQEITQALCSQAGDLRKKLVKVRTGIAEIHKTQKAFYLAAGRYVDAWKNKETLPVMQMESVLEEIEEHYERIEAARIMQLQETRAAEIAVLQQEGAFIPGNLGELADEVYNNYLLGVKTAHEQRIAAEKAAAEVEAKRLADEIAEQKRIREENEKLKKEAEEAAVASEIERRKQAAILAKQKAEFEAKEREVAAKAEAERKAQAAREQKEREAHEAELAAVRKEQERVQVELNAKAEAERKAQAEAAAREEAELAKGDVDKVADLIVALTAMKTRFVFKSKKNQKMYSDVGVLMDKVVAFIQSQK